MLTQIERLMDGYPSPGSIDPARRISGYVTAIEDYDGDTLREAVTNFLKGRVSDHNPDFCPTPARLATECRRILDARITDQQRHKAAALQIEQREEIFHMDPPELRRMAVDAGLAKLKKFTEPEKTPEQIAAKAAADAAYLSKHDAAFVDTSPAATAKRLGLPFFRQTDERQERHFTQDAD